MQAQSFTEIRSKVLRNGIGYKLKKSPNGTTLVIDKQRPTSLSENFPFKAKSSLADEVYSIKMQHGYLNSILPTYDGDTWVSNVTSIDISNTDNYIVVQFDFNVITHETSNVDIIAVASITSPSFSTDTFTCQIPICSFTWDVDTLTSLEQLRYGNISAQVWGSNLVFWIS